eukprot:gene13033-17466_t
MSDKANEIPLIVKLVSQDNETFEVTHKVAQLSSLICELLPNDQDNGDMHDIMVYLPEIAGNILARVVEYCANYNTEPMRNIPKPLPFEDLSRVVQKFYSDFINIDNETLFRLFVVAYHLDIKPLVDLCAAKIASYIKNKTPEQIRMNLGIVNDLTPEEEIAIREDYKWVDEM